MKRFAWTAERQLGVAFARDSDAVVFVPDGVLFLDARDIADRSVRLRATAMTAIAPAQRRFEAEVASCDLSSTGLPCASQ